MWTANTERFCDICPGKNDTADNLLKAIDEDYSEILPSTLFAVASILEEVILERFDLIDFEYFYFVT